MDDDNKFTITLDDSVSGDNITINLNDTYGTTTTYFSGDSITDKTIDLGNYTLSGDFGDMQVDQSWQAIYPSDVESMCKEYPALKQVWEKFIVIYDMGEKDYEGKIKAGEIDDEDIPF